jgi:hypothetical protein
MLVCGALGNHCRTRANLTPGRGVRAAHADTVAPIVMMLQYL